MTETMRLFVGTDIYQRAAGAERALENSLKRHTPGDVDITWMRQGDPGWDWGGQGFAWCTPFSMFRWFIPECCNYKGKAIYMDADMVVMRDLAELWNAPLDGRVGAYAGRMSSKADVILWDCEAVKGYEQPWSREPNTSTDIGDYDGRQSLARKHGAQALYRSCLPAYWDHRDMVIKEGPDRTGILHWTKLSCQPYHPYKHAYEYKVPYIGKKEAADVFWDYLGCSEEEWQTHPDRIPIPEENRLPLKAVGVPLPPEYAQAT